MIGQPFRKEQEQPGMAGQLDLGRGRLGEIGQHTAERKEA